MKILSKEVLIKKAGLFPELESTIHEIEVAISKVNWPVDNDQFAINPTPKGNGVKSIKNACMAHLQHKGWSLETRLKISSEMKPGPLDATKKVSGGRAFALEWETGNISSSHRAINKMAIGMLERVLVGGVLILPSRAMYNYLTDRVGNFQELRPYFNAWRNLNIQDGYLAVFEIEHDSTDIKSPLIPKGTDGWGGFK